MDRSAILLQGLISNPESVTTEDLAWVIIIVKGIINGEMGDAVTNWTAYAQFTGARTA